MQLCAAEVVAQCAGVERVARCSVQTELSALAAISFLFCAYETWCQQDGWALVRSLLHSISSLFIYVNKLLDILYERCFVRPRETRAWRREDVDLHTVHTHTHTQRPQTRSWSINTKTHPPTCKHEMSQNTCVYRINMADRTPNHKRDELSARRQGNACVLWLCAAFLRWNDPGLYGQ